MKGQWIGKYTGTDTGNIVINIDERSNNYDGIAFLHSDIEDIPPIAVTFATKNKENSFSLTTSGIYTENPINKSLESWDNVKKYYNKEDVFIPKIVNINGSWSEENIELSWTTDIHTNGNCSLPCSKANKPSELTPIPGLDDLKRFNEYCSIYDRHIIFRGQNKPWRLRTSFHRNGRFNLHRFLNEDVRSLHKHLSARTKHIFNLDNSKENGAFLNLAQHHGYPTPFLDWTYSPYVAAFFAYRGISSEDAARSDPNEKVRIYAFNLDEWRKNFLQSEYIATSSLHISLGDFLAIENERMLPQQAVSLVTNIDDIEGKISPLNSEEIVYLAAIDLSITKRDEIIRQLEYMGITAASMFPGIDGVCEELKERNFKYYKKI